LNRLVLANRSAKERLKTYAAGASCEKPRSELRSGKHMTSRAKPRVILVGTAHTIQLSSEEFGVFVEALCRRHCVRALAEELSYEAMLARDVSSSICIGVAARLKVPHVFCDPDTQERLRLGILQENDIRADGFARGWSAGEIQLQVEHSYRKRERNWSNRLQSLNRWPVLFVCGASHVKNFVQVLSHADIGAYVAALDWSATAELPFLATAQRTC
jgi:hypothetical protein